MEHDSMTKGEIVASVTVFLRTIEVVVVGAMPGVTEHAISLAAEELTTMGLGDTELTEVVDSGDGTFWLTYKLVPEGADE